jgi:mono/diheme cytochrome c family protein
LDDEWIHGGSAEDVVNVVTNGVVEKGMLAWGPILGAEAVNNVAAYVLSRNAESAAGTPAAPAVPAEVASESAVTDLVITAEAVNAGEGVFTQFCVACHGPNLQGGIGPNLLDDEWIHGGTAADIMRTITNGVPEKGMVAWGPVLGTEGVSNVAAYVISKNAKALGREPGS